MDTIRKADVSAAERAKIFYEQYGNDLDAGVTLADLVLAAGDYIGRIVGEEDTDAGMARIVERVVSVSGPAIEAPNEWRRALNNARSNCFSEWRIGSRLHDLAAYAVYGIVLDESPSTEEREKIIEALLEEARSFLSASPLSEWGLPPNNDLSRLVRLASNRWALDHGEPVEPAALAEFGGVSEGRIRNMMSGSGRVFNPVDGRIPAQEALTWLRDRKEFWNSVWRDQPLPPYGGKRAEPIKNAVFVPVARDGTPFHPGLGRGSGFTIGEKGAEVQIATFEDALAQLQRMPVPYWRRPNAKGNWGIVAGVRWERLDASDLELLAANPDHKLPDDQRA